MALIQFLFYMLNYSFFLIKINETYCYSDILLIKLYLIYLRTHKKCYSIPTLLINFIVCINNLNSIIEYYVYIIEYFN